MTASIYAHMANDISSDPHSASHIAVPNTPTGFAGWVLARFGPWGAILIILAAIMWFSLTVYRDSQKRNDQLVTIVQTQSENQGKQAMATSEQTRAISDLVKSTDGLKQSVEQMHADFRDQRAMR